MPKRYSPEFRRAASDSTPLAAQHEEADAHWRAFHVDHGHQSVVVKLADVVDPRLRVVHHPGAGGTSKRKLAQTCHAEVDRRDERAVLGEADNRLGVVAGDEALLQLAHAEALGLGQGAGSGWTAMGSRGARPNAATRQRPITESTETGSVG
jgi:hypothetical protein